MSKRAPEMTWQDKAILVTIPLVVFTIFIVANYISKDLSLTEAFGQQLAKVNVRDAGSITQVFPVDQTATDTQICRVRTRDGQTEFTFRYHVQASQTMNLQVGRLIQFFGEYNYQPQGGTLDVPFKGKSGRHTGWAVYENHRYSTAEEDQSGL